FNPKKTTRARGTKLLRETILETVVSCTLPAGSTHQDIVRMIARQSATPLPIATIPDVLNEGRSIRGVSLFGFWGTLIDRTVRQYDGMEWWMSENGLHIGSIEPSTFSEFDETAGKLMFDVRARRAKSNRLPKEEYIRIACELDGAGFKPVEHLEGKDRKALASWNKQYPRKAIRNFGAALSTNVPTLNLRRAVLRRLSRAESTWKKRMQLSSL